MQIKRFQMLGPAARYGFAAAVTAAAILLRYPLAPLFGSGYAYITIYPVIIIVAILAGLGPALLSSVSGALAAEYLFTPGLDPSDTAAVSIVIFTGFLAGWLARRLHRVMDKTALQAEALEAKNKELETVIGIVSHDLRAPLVNVRGFASEIDKDILAARQLLAKEPALADALKKLEPAFDSFRESLRFITSSAEAIDNLAISLVNVARAGLGAINPERLDMNEIVAKALTSIQFKFRQNNVTYEVSRNLPACFGDKTQVTQIFTNILDNAVKYLDPTRPGEIQVDGSAKAGRAVYRVSDNGIGIAPENQERVFDPYYQLHEKAAGGVGLGLATVKRMVDRNGGRIWVDSVKGKGSTFYVELPTKTI